MAERSNWQQLEALIDAACAADPDADLETLVEQFLEGMSAAEAAAVRQQLQLVSDPGGLTGLLADSVAPLGALPAGSQVGHYRVLERLADGGMGEVYLAERADGQFDKQVALKILSEGLITESMVQRFKRERQILAQLSHPHIATLYDAGMTDNNRPWFAMEFVSGVNINTHCEQQNCSVEACLSLFIMVCEAIAYAHSKGIIHRDLKPANIWIDTAEHLGQPKVLDFGIATIQLPQLDASPMTGTGQIIGTPGYMSPEQILGCPDGAGEAAESPRLDGRSDVFALGVILYQLMTRRHPFAADSITETNYKVLKEAPPTIPGSQLRADLVAIIEQCLAKDPADRYPSVPHLVADLKAYLAGDPVRARRLNGWQRMQKKIKKHPLVSALGASVLVLLVGGAWLLVTERWRSQQFAQVVQEYALVSKQMEQSVREEHLLPHHSLAPKYSQIKQQLSNLSATIEDGAMNGPVYAAMGQAHWLLNQPAKAVVAFAQAAESGFSNPTTEIQYGLALAMNWELKRSEAHLIRDAAAREATVERWRQQFLQPAQVKLSVNIDEAQQATYLKAYLAFLQEDHAQAITLAQQAFAENPGLYEALRLGAEAHLTQGKILTIDGQFKAALAAYRQAQGLLQQALEIGRSDLQNHALYCELLNTQLHVSIDNAETSYEDKLKQAKAACEQANALLPGQLNVLVSLAEVHGHWSSWQSDLGLPSIEHSMQMVDHARAAHALKPEHLDVLSLLVVGLIKITGESNQALSDEAKQALLAEAQAYAEQSVSLDPNDAYNWANLGDISYTLADRGLTQPDISQWVEVAIDAYQQANALLPSYAWHYMTAHCHRTWARHHRHHGRLAAAQQAFELANQEYTTTVQQSPDFAAGWRIRAENLTELMTINQQLDIDSGPWQTEGLAAITRACELYTAHSEVPQDFAELVRFFVAPQAPASIDACLLQVLNNAQPVVAEDGHD
ncbi:serine/threonine-protein kinase [Marinicella meishanensis]|uniref:serine/threonine-protein kinase n=1 Tax=Marinicella meishanensis TaxID=2873263 RepID=UPI001CBE4252|nr:serine/threonine-protein kinase [Marinicella sp. NBU2979]